MLLIESDKRVLIEGVRQLQRRGRLRGPRGAGRKHCIDIWPVPRVQLGNQPVPYLGTAIRA